MVCREDSKRVTGLILWRVFGPVLFAINQHWASWKPAVMSRIHHRFEHRIFMLYIQPPEQLDPGCAANTVLFHPAISLSPTAGIPIQRIRC